MSVPHIDAHWQLWPVVAITIAAVVFYAREKQPLEFTSILVICSLLVLFQFFPIPDAQGDNLLSPAAILAGFAHPALITVLSLLVLGRALFLSGALDATAAAFSRFAKKHPKQAPVAILLLACVASALINNTPVVVMFIPLLTAVSARIRSSASTVMMPLSFVCLLGGMTTLVGSSTNLLADAAAQNSGYPPLNFFATTPLGVILAAVGAVYVIFVIPKTLPNRLKSQPLDKPDPEQLEHIIQFTLPPFHPLIGEAGQNNQFTCLQGMTVKRIIRNGAPLPKRPYCRLKVNDVVIARATPLHIAALLAQTPDALGRNLHQRSAEPHPVIAEAVVAPGSSLLGSSPDRASQPGFIVLGVERNNQTIQAPLNMLRLLPGDVLLLAGERTDIRQLRGNRDLILLEWSTTRLPSQPKPRFALAVTGAAILSAAAGLLPLVTAAFLAAAVAVAAKLISLPQALRSVEPKIFLLVPAALALAAALDATGAAALAAHSAVVLFQDAHPALLLSAVFLAVAVLTNVLTNNAAAVIATPVALAAAQEIGANPQPFLLAVIFAANCSFATPVSYQTNLLVMTPGHYQFRDFLKAGTPLIFIIWITFSFLAPIIYPLLPSKHNPLYTHPLRR